MKQKLLILLSVVGGNLFTYGQIVTNYPEMPRIDVHTHPANDYLAIENYLKLREVLKEKYSVDFAFWINLSSGEDPVHNLDSVMKMSQNRSLVCISDYKPHKVLSYKPEDLQKKLDEGFAGYKIWYGTKSRVLKEDEEGYPYVDDEHNDQILSEMEEIGMVAASMHIADPNGPFGNRTKWCPDPVEYWRMIRAFTNMLEKHPNLIVVGAHAFWLICQDAQIDYLRYILTSYPNVYIDLAATFQYQNMVSYENLRNFMIEYADRILYGTDAGQWHSEEEIQFWAKAYNRTFRILETNQMVEGSFFSEEPMRGLKLPRAVLEKIYYKNALKIYPGLKQRMLDLNYDIN